MSGDHQNRARRRKERTFAKRVSGIVRREGGDPPALPPREALPDINKELSVDHLKVLSALGAEPEQIEALLAAAEPSKAKRVLGEFGEYIAGRIEGEELIKPNDPEAARRSSWRIWRRAAERWSQTDASRAQTLALIGSLIKMSHRFVVPESELRDDFKFFDYSREWGDALAGVADTFRLPFPVCCANLPFGSLGFIARLERDFDKAVRAGYSNANIRPGLSDEGGAEGAWIVALMMAEGLVVVGEGRPVIAGSSFALAYVESTLDVDGDHPILRLSVDLLGVLAAVGENPPVAIYTKTIGERAPDYAKTIYAATGKRHSTLIKGAAEWLFGFFLHVQTADRFVVQISPEQRTKRPRKPGPNARRRLPPLQELPVYVSLKPAEIRERLAGEPSDRRRPRGHERRAHFRRLHAERFRWKRGQLVPVRASWVGPVSGETTDGREYRVLLELASPFVGADVEENPKDPGELAEEKERT